MQISKCKIVVPACGGLNNFTFYIVIFHFDFYIFNLPLARTLIVKKIGWQSSSISAIMPLTAPTTVICSLPFPSRRVKPSGRRGGSMVVPIEINVGGYSNAMPNESTLIVIRDATSRLGSVPGISVRILYSESTPGWRFFFSFSWEGRRFAEVEYGYGGGEVVFTDGIPDSRGCTCRKPGGQKNILPFESEPLQKILAEFLLAAVENEETRLQRIRESVKIWDRNQESRIAHSGSGMTKC